MWIQQLPSIWCFCLTSSGREQVSHDIVAETIDGAGQRKGRGRNKTFPVMSFEDSLLLPESISEHGLDGEIRRMTLMDIIDLSPTSSKTRDLISSCYKYGLTLGNYRSESLQLTENGQVLLNNETPPEVTKAKQFELAIKQIEPFGKLYDGLKGKKLPGRTVLEDKAGDVGIEEGDRAKAAKTFEANLRFVGLVKDIAGSEHVVKVDDLVQDVQGMGRDNLSPPATSSRTEAADTRAEAELPAAKNDKTAIATKRPPLHIDIQVHIDPTSSAEQIDQIFASMARYLYGNEA